MWYYSLKRSPPKKIDLLTLANENTPLTLNIHNVLVARSVILSLNHLDISVKEKQDPRKTRKRRNNKQVDKGREIESFPRIGELYRAICCYSAVSAGVSPINMSLTTIIYGRRRGGACEVVASGV